MKALLYALLLTMLATPASALCLRVEGTPHDKLAFFRFTLTQFKGIEITSISGCTPQVGVVFLYQHISSRGVKAYAVAAATDHRKIAEDPKRVVFPNIVAAHGKETNDIIYRLAKATVDGLLPKKEKKV